MGCRAEGEDALFRTAFLLVAARAAEGCVEAIFVERLLKPFGLPHVGMQRAVVERVDPALLGFGILVNDQFHPRITRGLFAQRIHVPELPRRIDMHQREGRGRRVESFLGKVQHDGAVLADRIEHHRSVRLGGDFAHDVDALGLEPLEVSQGLGFGHVGLRNTCLRDRSGSSG